MSDREDATTVESCTRCGVPFVPDSSKVVVEWLYVHGRLERRGEYCPECVLWQLRKWREEAPHE